MTDATAGSPAAGRRQLGMTDVKRLNRGWRRSTRANISLLLDGVGQPYNLGSIIRTPAPFAVRGICLCGGTASPDHPSARTRAPRPARLLPFRPPDSPPPGPQPPVLA